MVVPPKSVLAKRGPRGYQAGQAAKGGTFERRVHGVASSSTGRAALFRTSG